VEFFEKLQDKAEKDEVKQMVAGGVILNENNEVLLLKRKQDDFMGGIFELPSGKIEEGETIRDGLIREIKEETALNVTSIGMYITEFDYLSGSGKKSRQLNFEVKAQSDESIILTEHDEFKWFKISEIELDNNITDEVKYVIAVLAYNKNL
jgi:8-oxo-dGTP diphosphatase